MPQTSPRWSDVGCDGCSSRAGKLSPAREATRGNADSVLSCPWPLFEARLAREMDRERCFERGTQRRRKRNEHGQVPIAYFTFPGRGVINCRPWRSTCLPACFAAAGAAGARGSDWVARRKWEFQGVSLSTRRGPLICMGHSCKGPARGPCLLFSLRLN